MLQISSVIDLFLILIYDLPDFILTDRYYQTKMYVDDTVITIATKPNNIVNTKNELALNNKTTCLLTSLESGQMYTNLAYSLELSKIQN